MAGRTVPVKSVRRIGSLLEELAEIERQLSRRAFELFERRGWGRERELDDWLQAEKELLWRPCAELTERASDLRLSFVLAGLTPKDVEVRVEPDRVTVRAATSHEHRKEEGGLHFCEFHQGSLYRSIRLPAAVVPEKAKAELREGFLTVTLPKAKEPAGKKIPIEG
ncbi:MAG: Hsp20/alpha crystallin family protein [candidate division NC10 bacterium]|mgnify:FL=1